MERIAVNGCTFIGWQSKRRAHLRRIFVHQQPFDKYRLTGILAFGVTAATISLAIGVVFFSGKEKKGRVLQENNVNPPF